MSLKSQIIASLKDILSTNFEADSVSFSLEAPVQSDHGDYSTNISLILGKKLGKNPMEIAEVICEELRAKGIEKIEKVEAIKPGFINFWVSKEALLTSITPSKEEKTAVPLKDKRIMVEYAHPNTHKEMHIGHMRTLITGEALCRLFEASGAVVFRANYQGDIGPHVAKALYGIEVLMRERSLSIDDVEEWDSKAKAHFLGEGYVRGNKDYEEHKEEIDAINTALYKGTDGSKETKGVKSGAESVWDLYKRTRKWSLDYYDEFYKRFYTKFDQLFFESEVAEAGRKIVEDHVGKVFAKENGAIIFPGEKYGLHTRVFITQAGNPTYEGKEMGNAYAEYKAFPFDLKMHIVASEQAGYFQVVFKALDLIDPEKFEKKQHHLSMGMVTLTDRKMSSRTGDVLTVDWLIDQVRERVDNLAKEGKIKAEKRDETIEMITIGAIKYSVLKGGTGQNAAFDIEKSVSLDGNSGPYLQYTYARTRSVLGKWQMANGKLNTHEDHSLLAISYSPEELALLRKLYQFDDVVAGAAENYAPNHVATYLFDLAQLFNLFYQKHKVIGSEQEEFRLVLTESVGNTLQRGLNLLGIMAPEQM